MQCGNLQSFWKLALRVWGRWRLVTRMWGGEYLLHCDDNEDLSLDQGGGEEWVLWHQNLQWKENVFICNQLYWSEFKSWNTNIQKYFEFWNRIFYFYVQPLLWTYCSPGSWSIIIISTANETGDIQNSLCHIKERTTGSRVPPSVLSSHIIVNYFYVYVCLSLLWKSMINK